MADLHLNFAYSTVATAPSPATSGTSLVVAAAAGAAFPPAPFEATVWPVSVQPLGSNAEVVTVTAIATDTFTIVRAREGSSARTIVIGDQIAATITRRTLQQLEGKLTSDTDLIQAGYSRYVPDAFEILDQDTLEIADTAVFEIG
jgi:hypothetical protein